MQLSEESRQLLLWSCFSIFLMLICAGSSSPLYPHYIGADASVFLTVTKGILNGKIPYIDLFDHKGPIFYWMETIGYFFGGRTGVFLFQCLLLIVNLIFLSRIATLFHTKLSTTALPFFSTFFFLFEHGNLTEEFNMPLALAGIYYELKYLAPDDEKHSLRIAYFYGIILGLLAFIRVNNAITLYALLLCIVASLIRKSQWINLLQNLLLGLLGLVTVSVPVCWYFYTHGALYDSKR